jgi:hypothetical protein
VYTGAEFGRQRLGLILNRDLPRQVKWVNSPQFTGFCGIGGSMICIS